MSTSTRTLRGTRDPDEIVAAGSAATGSGTFDFLTAKAGLPGGVAGAVIFTELVASLLLITGAFTRIAAFGIMSINRGVVEPATLD